LTLGVVLSSLAFQQLMRAGGWEYLELTKSTSGVTIVYHLWTRDNRDAVLQAFSGGDQIKERRCEGGRLLLYEEPGGPNTSNDTLSADACFEMVADPAVGLKRLVDSLGLPAAPVTIDGRKLASYDLAEHHELYASVVLDPTSGLPVEAVLSSGDTVHWTVTVPAAG
jgi:hypothetical protein